MSTAADEGTSGEHSCAACGVRQLAVRSGGGLRWVCGRCPLPTRADGEALVARWWSWLGDHGVPLAAAPCATPGMWWAPAARTLLVIDADPSDQLVTLAARRGVEHGWDVVWLGDRPDAMHVLVDNHLERHPRPARVRRNSPPPLDHAALAGWCTDCGVFQWHTHWGWWMCRACGHADGDMTLEPLALHGPGITSVDGLPNCTTCRAAWGLA